MKGIRSYRIKCPSSIDNSSLPCDDILTSNYTFIYYFGIKANYRLLGPLRPETSEGSKGYKGQQFDSVQGYLRAKFFIGNIKMYSMTSSNGNIFRVTGPLCGEFTSHRWIPLTKASDAELWCFLWSAPWINNRESGDLRRHRARAHYDVIVIIFNRKHKNASAMTWHR